MIAFQTTIILQQWPVAHLREQVVFIPDGEDHERRAHTFARVLVEVAKRGWIGVG